ncbi:MAG: phenylalanine--tRNA ligase subunit beta [Hadesarchaea archaeon B3_Hades]|nr:MAG: phenylalanine--tRNA ligase subunit beta [Hadesarchaea archaeon B3_Hades]
MPSITVSYRDLCKLLGRRIGLKKLLGHLVMIGIDITEAAGDELKLEVAHNRPDLLSPEGVARVLKGFLGIEIGLPSYEPSASGVMVQVDRSVKPIRPFIAAGVVTKVKLIDEIVASLMQVQEKLHASLCRNRRRGSIGVYDLDTIEPPVRYTTTLPDGIRFVPLEFNRELTPAQILREHPKGIEYGSITRGWSRYPLLVDSRGVVLSIPPIINSESTCVTSKTRQLFIDVTGEDERVANQSLTILMTGLAERGFELRSVAVKYPGRRVRTPDLRPRRHRLSARNANEFIGLNLKPRGIAKIAERMRYGIADIWGDALTLLAPPYRSDLMHEVDIIEDIAIGYGYDQLEPTVPKVVTTGERTPIERLSERARRVLTGLGFMEAMTYTLTNLRTNFELMRARGEAVEIANPVSEEYTIIRNSLFPCLLSVLRANRRNPLPQRVFEVGDVALLDEGAETGARNVRRAAAAVIGEGLGFTYIKAVAETLLRELGISHEVRPIEHSSFLEGRAAEFVSDGKSLGVVGEIHPEVILGFELEHPVVTFEFDLG